MRNCRFFSLAEVNDAVELKLEQPAAEVGGVKVAEAEISAMMVPQDQAQ